MNVDKKEKVCYVDGTHFIVFTIFNILQNRMTEHSIL